MYKYTTIVTVDTLHFVISYIHNECVYVLFDKRNQTASYIIYYDVYITGIIVTWSQTNGQYEYNIVAVVLLTEVLKLIVSAILYWKE